MSYVHTEKKIPNLVKSNQIMIVIILFRLIWHQIIPISVITIQTWFDLSRFRNYFSVCEQIDMFKSFNVLNKV